MWKRLGAWVVLCSVVCLLTQPSCTEKDEAEVLRGMIKKGAALAEGHDVGGLIDLTTEDFAALPGNRDRHEVRGILLMACRGTTATEWRRVLAGAVVAAVVWAADGPVASVVAGSAARISGGGTSVKDQKLETGGS